MRYDTHESFNREIILDVDVKSWIHRHSWLTQANYIFGRLQVESDLENYVLVDNIYFSVFVPSPTVACPRGYLFLCPEDYFRVGASFKWPDVPAYWSLNPSGVEHLSTEEATRLGFPPLKLTTIVNGISWDTSVYEGLRQFHRAKGFNPESQELARHLGHPLFRLVNPHVGEYDDSDDEGDKYWADDEGAEDWDDEDSENYDWRDHCETDGTSVDERDDTEAEWTDEEEAQSTSGAEGPDHCESTPEAGDEVQPDRHDSHGDPDGASPMNERGNTQTEWCGKQEQPASVTGGEVHCNPAPKKHQRPSDADIEMRGPSPATEGNPGVSQLQYLEDTTSQPMLHSTDEDVPISTTFEILMNIQLALILFLAACWVYDNQLAFGWVSN
ncbi:hypothetical protein C8R46DRAFT_241194 [Mycena filopes]|nr:hypothetical protein C8R46DRAFT_241194 [Mycena filopes]